MTKKLTKKEAALDYLQAEAVSLREKVPTLVSAEYAGGKLVLTVLEGNVEAPEISHKGVKLDVVVQVTKEEVPVVEAPVEEDTTKAASILKKYPGAVGPGDMYQHTSEEAIGPDPKSSKDSTAYVEWKKRHNK